MLILWGLWSCFPEIWISQDILSPSLVRSSNHFIGCSCMLMWIPLVCGRTNIEAGRRAEWLVGGFNLFQNCPKVSKGTGQMGWIMTYRELSNQYYIIANDRDFGMQYLLSLHDSFEVTAGTSQHSKSWDFRSFNGIIFGNFYHRFTIVLATRTPTVSPRNGAMRLLHCTKVLRGHVGSEERDRDLPDVSPRIYGVFSWCFMGIQWDILESYYITKHI